MLSRKEIEALFPLEGEVTQEIIDKSVNTNPMNCIGYHTLKAALGEHADNILRITWGVYHGHIDYPKEDDKDDSVDIQTEDITKVTEIKSPRKLKFILSAILFLLSFNFAFAQPSVEIFGAYPLDFGAGANYEVRVFKSAFIDNIGIPIEGGVNIKTSNTYPVAHLQTGVVFPVGRYNEDLRVMVGVFYHTGYLPVDAPDTKKESRIQILLPGASVRYLWTVGMYIGADYNGSELKFLRIGYLFNHSKNQIK